MQPSWHFTGGGNADGIPVPYSSNPLSYFPNSLNGYVAGVLVGAGPFQSH